MADRAIIYPGQVPLETDLLKTNQFSMVGLAKLCAAVFGVAGMANGFATTQSTIPALTVSVAPGEIYSPQNLEATAFSSLAADTTHTVVKQGISLDAVTLAITPPGTAGFSINYLIQVGYQDTDTGSAVLPYYNASNPSIAYSGPANSGAAQPTTRQGTAVVSTKAGTAATTGTQTTPAPDSGKLGLYVVTVANGASTILNANISAYAGAPLLATPAASGRLIARRVFTSTQIYTPTPGTNAVDVLVQAGGGGGGGAPPTGAGQTSGGAGGGGGGWARKRITSAFAGVTVTVGAAGTAGTSAGSNGGTGGASSFGALVSATGGAGGSGTAAVSNSNVTLTGVGAFGIGSSGDFNGYGTLGRYAVLSISSTSGDGGAGFFGGGAQYVTGTSAGTNAAAFGAGGSGGVLAQNIGSGAAGGAGGAGVVIVEEYS